jgi:thioredoxin-related protein
MKGNMNKYLFLTLNSILIFLCLIVPSNLLAQTKDINIIIHLRGVYESKISLLPMSGARVYKSILEVQAVENGESTKLTVPKEYLPGEFVLRFDYKEKQSSTPYPVEKNILIYNQDLELWVSPIFNKDPDSTWFQKGEKENTAFLEFSKENSAKKEKIGLLQNFLMNYDDTKSNFYQQGINEYEQRRQIYNQWLISQRNEYKSLFVSSLFMFQYIPQIEWKGNETDRIKKFIDCYFDGMDFNDPLVIKTSNINKWMDNYINLYGQLSTSLHLRDSLFPIAGKTAIEKAKKGNPLVYGWMVDYFYKGFESNAIDAGMKILEPYINDTNCLTTKRLEITRRLTGMQTLIPGSKAPNISMTDTNGTPFELNSYFPQNKYILILFWSADCSHCAETVKNLYPWQQITDIQQRLKVVAISLDETETEVKKWEQKKGELKTWIHLRAKEGVNSKVAKDYFVLATPVMILIDAKTKNIVATPNTVDELMKSIQ